MYTEVNLLRVLAGTYSNQKSAFDEIVTCSVERYMYTVGTYDHISLGLHEIYQNFNIYTIHSRIPTDWRSGIANNGSPGITSQNGDTFDDCRPCRFDVTSMGHWGQCPKVSQCGRFLLTDN